MNTCLNHCASQDFPSETPSSHHVGHEPPALMIMMSAVARGCTFDPKIGTSSEWTHLQAISGVVYRAARWQGCATASGNFGGFKT
jgi:hypothetical protein